MLTDGKTISTPQHAQVCIIGSGPAGITAAWELSKAGLDVILLEAGKDPTSFEDSWPDKKILYDGVSSGLFTKNEPHFLTNATTTMNDSFPGERERVYGGTSTHWGGQNRPLDSIVFEERPGFPGWPISREDLDPYYGQASRLNHLVGDYRVDGHNFSNAFWIEKICERNPKVGAQEPHLKNFNLEMYQFMAEEWLHFDHRTFDGVTIRDSSVRVIINATVLCIVEQGGSVKHLNVASMKGDASHKRQKDTEFTVSAELYILACGAVANAHQLLLSNIGGDSVGHYFMCQPFSGNPIKPGQIPGKVPVVFAKEKFLNKEETNLLAGNDGGHWRDESGNINYVQGRFTITRNAAREYGIGGCWFQSAEGSGNSMYFEQASNYDSCITLGQNVDPVFHQKKVHINWAFTDLDRKTYKTNCRLFNEASSEYPSIINWLDWDEIIHSWVVNGHHIGTTRMSASDTPTEGVVDKNLKVHDLDNLYVAGSSVFPSAGVANPTMTIIALSIRLAEHVRGCLK